jgi:hypothetical protein
MSLFNRTLQQWRQRFGGGDPTRPSYGPGVRVPTRGFGMGPGQPPDRSIQGPQVPRYFPGGGTQQPGAEFLRQLGEGFIIPEIQAQQEQSGRFNELLFGSLEGDPGDAGLQYAERATEAFAEDLGRPGGQISQAIGGALRGSVQRGFGPGQTGKLRSDVYGVGREASRAVGNFFTQQALTARGQGIQREATLGQLAAGSRQDMLSLLGGLIGIGMGAEQLGLQRWAINRQLA